MSAIPASAPASLADFWRKPLSARPTFVGTVDASSERIKPIARTLEDAFGPAANGGVIVPMADDTPMHPSDKLVTVCSAVIGACLLVGLLVERLFF